MMYFIRPRYYPTWHEIAGHFNIIKHGELNEKPTCVHLLHYKTYRTYQFSGVEVELNALLAWVR